MCPRSLIAAGALDESVALLETLAHEYPGVGPAAIVRDPFFATPLARTHTGKPGANPERRARRERGAAALIATIGRRISTGTDISF